jgi:hypothetical protein
MDMLTGSTATWTGSSWTTVSPFSVLPTAHAGAVVIEGYKDAADKFSKESGLASADTRAIEQRVQIRDAIQQGDIERAVELLNDLNSEVRLLPTSVPRRLFST